MTKDLNLLLTRLTYNAILLTYTFKSNVPQSTTKCLILKVLSVITKVGTLLFGFCINFEHSEKEKSPSIRELRERAVSIRHALEDRPPSLLPASSVRHNLSLIRKDSQKVATLTPQTPEISAGQEPPVKIEPQSSLPPSKKETANEKIEILKNPSGQRAVALPTLEKTPTEDPVDWAQEKEEARARFINEFSFTVLDDFSPKVLNDSKFLCELFFEPIQNLEKLSWDYRLLGRPAKRAVLLALHQVLAEAEKSPNPTLGGVPLEIILKKGSLDRIFGLKDAWFSEFKLRHTH